MKKRLLAVDAATSVATAAMIAAVAPVTTEGAPAAACQPAYAASTIYAAGVKALCPSVSGCRLGRLVQRSLSLGGGPCDQRRSLWARPTAPALPHRPGMSSSSIRPMPGGTAGLATRCSPRGSMPSMVRSSNRGVPVDHACGLHAVGYSTGYLVSVRSYPPNASGSRPSTPGSSRCGD